MSEAKQKYARDLDRRWEDHVYPLKQVTIKLQGTRHSRLEDIIDQLDIVARRLRDGSVIGECHDDDSGYSFTLEEQSNGPSYFCESTGMK